MKTNRGNATSITLVILTISAVIGLSACAPAKDESEKKEFALFNDESELTPKELKYLIHSEFERYCEKIAKTNRELKSKRNKK
jgi:hypothetical protein